ncbi:Kelch-Like Protein 4 [Manis pentadactyla]|nr:Kelch-Like Protein 4 [Manis pentadactyla]
MSSLRFQFGVAVIDNKLYVLGGSDGLKTLNTMECFDPTGKIWTVMPPMSTPRHGLGGLQHNSHMDNVTIFKEFLLMGNSSSRELQVLQGVLF